MTRTIPLTQGHVALVDDEDYDQSITAGPWHLRINQSGVKYAKHSVTSTRSVFMHTVLTGWDRVDHINGDGLDNRRQNLRPASSRQNLANSRVRKDNKTGLKGVRQQYPNRWRATCDRKYLGLFSSPEEAARAYDAAALVAFGEYARLNYPKEHTTA